jgi:hypothetical protein
MSLLAGAVLAVYVGVIAFNIFGLIVVHTTRSVCCV